MSFGKKLSTLINATLRGGFPRRRKRRRAASDDAEAQLKAIREALAEVEVKERQVAEQLKAARAKTKAATESGNRAEEVAQRRMADELETHLETQSIEATHLAEKLTEIENRLAEEREQVEDNIATAQEVITRSQVTGGETEERGEEVPVIGDEETPTTDDDGDGDDLAARKSRLSR